MSSEILCDGAVRGLNALAPPPDSVLPMPRSNLKKCERHLIPAATRCQEETAAGLLRGMPLRFHDMAGFGLLFGPRVWRRGLRCWGRSADFVGDTAISIRHLLMRKAANPPIFVFLSLSNAILYGLSGCYQSRRDTSLNRKRAEIPVNSSKLSSRGDSPAEAGLLRRPMVSREKIRSTMCSPDPKGHYSLNPSYLLDICDGWRSGSQCSAYSSQLSA